MPDKRQGFTESRRKRRTNGGISRRALLFGGGVLAATVGLGVGLVNWLRRMTYTPNYNDLLEPKPENLTQNQSLVSQIIENPAQVAELNNDPILVRDALLNAAYEEAREDFDLEEDQPVSFWPDQNGPELKGLMGRTATSSSYEGGELVITTNIHVIDLSVHPGFMSPATQYQAMRQVQYEVILNELYHGSVSTTQSAELDPTIIPFNDSELTWTDQTPTVFVDGHQLYFMGRVGGSVLLGNEYNQPIYGGLDELFSCMYSHIKTSELGFGYAIQPEKDLINGGFYLFDKYNTDLSDPDIFWTFVDGMRSNNFTGELIKFFGSLQAFVSYSKLIGEFYNGYWTLEQFKHLVDGIYSEEKLQN